MKIFSPSPSSRRINDSTLSLRLWEFTGTSMLNLLIWIVVIVYLSPLTYMLVTSLKTADQMRDSRSPIWPAQAVTYSYQGHALQVYTVPTPEGNRQLALVNPHPDYSEFIDPANPGAGLIHWDGSWRALNAVYNFKLNWGAFVRLWQTVNYPDLLRNTMFIVVLGEIGVLCSSIAVAYGFSRFRIPGGKFLFFLLIATIMIPDSITLVPTFYIFSRVLHWNPSFLPLIVPYFFGNAIYIFLLRQNFRTIPRDLDEAAMIDGAGPLRTLVSIILPQAIPVVVTVALLHFFNAWNELRMASLYLGASQERTISFSVQSFVTYGFTPEVNQASALLLMIVPILVLVIAQRFFMQDMVITGIEK